MGVAGASAAEAGSPGVAAPRGRFPRADLALIALAVALAATSFWYPFGRDQGAHAYIGWGWLHGAIPFRDAVAQKPPGLYLLYLLGSALFGERQFGIRVLDLGGVLLGGWLAVQAVRRTQARRDGELGATILLACGFYYSSFGYWDTAQTEIWQGIAVLGGVVCIRGVRSGPRAALLSGALGGVAVLFKLTAGILCLGLSAALAARAWQAGGTLRQRAGRALGWGGLQVLGGAAVALATIGYFAAHGALRDAFDVLVRYNLAYAATGRPGPAAALDRALHFWVRNNGFWTALFLAGWLLAVTAARRRGDPGAREALLLPGGLLALGVAAVVWQGKYFPYHWGILALLLPLAGAYGLAELGRRAPRLLPGLALAALVPGLLLAPTWSSNRAAGIPRPTTYLAMIGRTGSYLTGRIPRREFLEPFVGEQAYRYADCEELGTAIRERARPGDRLVVRGFDPVIYCVSGLRSPSRFSIETVLQRSEVTFDRRAWIEEQERDIAADPPRFEVVREEDAGRIRELRRSGYRRIMRRGRLILFDRHRAAGGPPRPAVP